MLQFLVDMFRSGGYGSFRVVETVFTGKSADLFFVRQSRHFISPTDSDTNYRSSIHHKPQQVFFPRVYLPDTNALVS